MRREGYEFQVSRPEVIFHQSENGEMLEPYEEVHIETTSDVMGTVVEMLAKRQGRMLNMDNTTDGVRLIYLAPTRGLLGFRYQFMNATRGMGTMTSIFHGYAPLTGLIASRTRGSLVAWEDGVTNTFGLKNAEERGVLFLSPSVGVYEGMVVGEQPRPGDLAVNVCKQKHLTNMRSSNKDIDIRLTMPRQMSLDECIEYLADDELLEVTPQNLRIRKRVLKTRERGKLNKQAKRQALSA